jgi:DNA-binding NarL/FixJ family response regulator
MPKMNGIECLKIIKKNKTLENIPCIILTTSSDSKDIEETYSYGANLYLQKPSNFNDFVNMFVKIFEVDWKDHFPPKRELFLLPL